MKVKNGIASSSSLDRMQPNTRPGMACMNGHREIAEVDRQEAEEEADRGEREGDRVADEHEDDQPART